MPEKMTTRLKHLFERPEMTIVPGGTTVIDALMVQKAGYEAFYMSGGMTSMWLTGWTDVGITTMTEMVQNINRIFKAVDIPIFSDVDTGYGTAVNVYRTTKEYIWAGAAGFHLEDQEFPKKSGSMAGRRLVSIEEAVGKYKAAAAAKRELDPDFVICARTDSRGAEGGGFDEVLKRGKAYEEAGADVIFFESLQSWDECKTALKSVNIPAFCLLHAVIQPHPSLEEQQKAGQAIALYVGLGALPGVLAAWEMLVDFKERGVQAQADYIEGLKAKGIGSPFEVMSGIMSMGLGEVRDLEEQFLPKALKRDYESTIGNRPS